MINKIERVQRAIGDLNKPVNERKAMVRVIQNYKNQSKLKQDSYTKENEIDEFHFHEVMDRLSIVMGNMDDYLIAHPLCEHDDELKKDLETAFSLLYKQYQRVSEIRLNFIGEE